jgi:outer membrane immunogenic protein
VRKFLLGTAALIGLASPAMSADMRLPVFKAPPSVVPVWSWTGCFVGGHAGGVWAQKKDWTVRTPGGAFFGQSLGGHDDDGWLGGAQAGCDYQFAGGFVIGVQGDYAWADAEGSHDSTREIGVAYHSKVKSLATVTGRIGYAWDRFLGYVRGGGGWERDDYWATTTILGTAYTSRETRSGWTVAVGGEYAFTNSCPASSSTAITISAPPRSASRRKSPGCARHSSMSRRPRASCARVSTCASAVGRLRLRPGSDARQASAARLPVEPAKSTRFALGALSRWRRELPCNAARDRDAMRRTA